MRYLIWPLITAFAFAVVAGFVVLPVLRRLKMGQFIRDDGPSAHIVKAGTPTMGGIIFIVGGVLATILFSQNQLNWVGFCTITTVGYGIIGFLDDFLKIHRRQNEGLKPYQKMGAQLIFAVFIAVFAGTRSDIGTSLYVPILDIYWELGWFYYPFTIFVVVGVVNSVNLTDGLDGLASSINIIVCAMFAILTYLLGLRANAAGNVTLYSQYLTLAVFASSMAGSCMAFMRLNSFPARVIMGDTGALSLGGVVVILAVLSKMTLLLPVCAGMFMVSTISSLMQIFTFKVFRKRIFKMAPLHHHFELQGVHETKIVVYYIVVSVILCTLCLWMAL